MLSIPYDPTRKSLLNPGEATDFFTYGVLSSEAALCAEMSRLAYVKDKSLLAQYLGRNNSGFTLCKAYSDNSSGTQAFIAIEPTKGIAVVAFRGTESDDPTDLFTDITFIPKAWAPNGVQQGKVHGGFADAISNNIYQAIVSEIPKNAKRILFTGHSLGAALATLAASQYPHTDYLYTFGSPRVGDSEFAQSMHGVNHARYVDCCDMVTIIPPEKFGFVHVGTLRYINSHGQVLINPAEDVMSADQQEARVDYLYRHAFRHGTVPIRDLADHAPINYVSGVMGLRS